MFTAAVSGKIVFLNTGFKALDTVSLTLKDAVEQCNNEMDMPKLAWAVRY